MYFHLVLTQKFASRIWAPCRVSNMKPIVKFSCFYQNHWARWQLSFLQLAMCAQTNMTPSMDVIKCRIRTEVQEVDQRGVIFFSLKAIHVIKAKSHFSLIQSPWPPTKSLNLTPANQYLQSFWRVFHRCRSEKWTLFRASFISFRVAAGGFVVHLHAFISFITLVHSSSFLLISHCMALVSLVCAWSSFSFLDEMLCLGPIPGFYLQTLTNNNINNRSGKDE